MTMWRDDELLGIDLFSDDRDDARARVRTNRIVTTRKPHICAAYDRHEIPSGSRARVERAIIDDQWASFYFCCACLAQWLEEIGY